MQSTLDFGDAGELDITQFAVTATVGHAWPTWSVRGAIGIVLDGDLEAGDRTHDIGPGVVASLGVARRFPLGAFFIDVSASASISRTTTREGGGPAEALVAIDILRAGVTAGRTFGIVSPYVLARAFGGPVWWTLDDTDVTGTDTSHFQLGAGVSITSGAWSVVVDLAALGEQSASLGVVRRL
jgi:hypothetical protein